MKGHAAGICFGNIDHQLPAAGAALCTIYLRADLFIELMNKGINALPVLPVNETAETIIFILPFFCKPGNDDLIGFNFFDKRDLSGKSKLLKPTLLIAFL